MKKIVTGTLIMVLLLSGGCRWPPTQWPVRVNVECPTCGVVWTIQSTTPVEARWRCECGRELTTRPAEWGE